MFDYCIFFLTNNQHFIKNIVKLIVTLAFFQYYLGRGPNDKLSLKNFKLARITPNIYISLLNVCQFFFFFGGGLRPLGLCVRDRAPGPLFLGVLGQTHVNGWSRVITHQNGGLTDYIFPLRLRVLQWSRHLFNY